jgi:hypothetical protein
MDARFEKTSTNNSRRPPAEALKLFLQIFEQDLHATEAHHAEEVLGVVLPQDHQSTKVMQPSKESFPSPTPAVSSQRATVLCGSALS